MSDFLLRVLTAEQWVKLFKSFVIALAGTCIAVLAQAAADGNLGPHGAILVTALSTWVAGVLKTTLLDPVPLPAPVETKVREALDEEHKIVSVLPGAQVANSKTIA